MLTGSCCIVGAALFTARIQRIRAYMRPVYIELGIVPSEEIERVEEQVGN
jgi:hypothetical protein